jgi:hypothetical protein
LFPLAFEKAENMPAGDMGIKLAKERKGLLFDHPYLFNESWPVVDDDHESALDEHVQKMDLEIWGDKETSELDSDNEGLLQVQAIGQMFLEEASSILAIIRETCSQIAGDDPPGISEGALDIIRSKEHDMSSIMTRFVLECMFLRYLRSTDPKKDEELMETWQEGIELGRVEIDTSSDALDQTLQMLIEVHGTEDVARGMMSEAAEAAAELIGKKALSIMLKAANVPVDDPSWPPLMHDLVMLQMELNPERRRTSGRWWSKHGSMEGRRCSAPLSTSGPNAI